LGQNPEAENYDRTLNDVDVGGLIAQVVNHDGKRTAKAVVTRIGNAGSFTAMFDPTRLTFAKVWHGDLVKWQTPRYGITSGVKPSASMFKAERSR